MMEWIKHGVYKHECKACGDSQAVFELLGNIGDYQLLGCCECNTVIYFWDFLLPQPPEVEEE